jgi:retinol dehydrogenase-12
LSSFQSIRQAAEVLTAQNRELDSLTLNAGTMMTSFGPTEVGIEQQVGVNHFGHLLLTQLLLPMVEATSSPTVPATIVVLTSMAHLDSRGVYLTLEALNDGDTYSRVKA